MIRRWVACGFAGALALAIAGCFNPFDPLIGSERAASTPAPAPTSPENVIKLFKWCWQNRDPAKYSEIFTDDYRFQFAPNDSAGNPYRDRPWLREDEMFSATHLFTGGTDRPPASDIQIDIGNTLLVLPDPRPDRNPTLFKSIRVQVTLKVTIDQNGTPDVNTISGAALFYLARGDTAAIPKELLDKGFKKDANRWWIDRWEDETAGATSPFRAREAGPDLAFPYVPPHPITFGRLKLRFR